MSSSEAIKLINDLKKVGVVGSGMKITAKGARMIGKGVSAGDMLKMDGKGLFGSIWKGVKKVADLTVSGAKKLLDLGKSVGITPSALALASGRPGVAAGLKLVGQGKKQRGRGLIKSTDRGYYSPNSNLTDKAVY